MGEMMSSILFFLEGVDWVPVSTRSQRQRDVRRGTRRVDTLGDAYNRGVGTEGGKAFGEVGVKVEPPSPTEQDKWKMPGGTDPLLAREPVCVCDTTIGVGNVVSAWRSLRRFLDDVDEGAIVMRWFYLFLVKKSKEMSVENA